MSADKLFDSFKNLAESHHKIKINELEYLEKVNLSSYHEFVDIYNKIQNLKNESLICDEKCKLFFIFI